MTDGALQVGGESSPSEEVFGFPRDVWENAAQKVTSPHTRKIICYGHTEVYVFFFLNDPLMRLYYVYYITIRVVG